MNSPNSPDSSEAGTDQSKNDMLDWYLPEKSDSRHHSPYEPDSTHQPGKFHSMIQKLHIGTTLAALVLFFLPWIDIQCSQQSIATQTGIQTIYGGGSPSKEMQAFMAEESPNASTDSKSDESMGIAPLVALAFLAVIGAVLLSFIALRSDEKIQTTLIGVLCAAALALLAIQMTIGFPAKSSIGKSMAENSKAEASANPMDNLGSDMATAMMAMIQVRHLPSLYITLILLGFPTLVLANDLLDKLKKPSP
jgi:hypothetical protein